MVETQVAASRLRRRFRWCAMVVLWSGIANTQADDIGDLKRAVDALREENRALQKRVMTLESEKVKRESTAPPQQNAAGAKAAPPATPEAPNQGDLEQRIKTLEMSKTAQEDAVRHIIKDSMSKSGSKINESVTLGGNFELKAGRGKDLDFSGKTTSTLALSAVQLDLEIQANDWSTGTVIVEYDDGSSASFVTSSGSNAPVDRINLDQAHLTIGDVQRFPLYVKAGRLVLPFGISTGSPWADVLSVSNPLTIDAFEFRNTAIGFGWAIPTPALTPATPPVVVPPVKPLVINPLASALGRSMGYRPPPARPKSPTTLTLAPNPPPFTGAVYLYSGSDYQGGTTLARHIGATVGYKTKSNCDRPYSELTAASLCPRSFDVDVSYNSSVFDSKFLEAEYRTFLPQIGAVRGLSSSVKSSFGPISLVGEWNGALRRARFTDGNGNAINIKPSAWQLSLGYQFDWNPWVETIGAQGTFAALGYSESKDFAGAVDSSSGTATRVGFLPKRRLLITGGEWVMDGLRLTVEYSHNWDYSIAQGGTGKSSNGVFTLLTYVW